jgi:hypothetical protein
MKMRTNNKGLTVKVNLFALEKYLDAFSSHRARLWMRGQVINSSTGEKKMFNDAGELISTLGKWNAEQFRKLKSESS